MRNYVGREIRHVIVAEGGSFHNRGTSSLEIEILALSEVIDFLVTYL